MNILFFFTMILIIIYLSKLFKKSFNKKIERKVIMTCKAFDELEEKDYLKR